VSLPGRPTRKPDKGGEEHATPITTLYLGLVVIYVPKVPIWKMIDFN
jgi:hypothetical protein